jgi:hypothetical protein
MSKKKSEAIQETEHKTLAATPTGSLLHELSMRDLSDVEVASVLNSLSSEMLRVYMIEHDLIETHDYPEGTQLTASVPSLGYLIDAWQRNSLSQTDAKHFDCVIAQALEDTSLASYRYAGGL